MSATAPKMHGDHCDDDGADEEAGLAVVDAAHREPADEDAEGGPREKFPEEFPLDVTAVRSDRDEITDDEEREDESADLFGMAGENLREQGDGEQAQATDAGFGETDDDGGERGEEPLPEVEGHCGVTERKFRRDEPLIEKRQWGVFSECGFGQWPPRAGGDGQWPQ